MVLVNIEGAMPGICSRKRNGDDKEANQLKLNGCMGGFQEWMNRSIVNPSAILRE
jgi:hypothetical protein